MSHESSTCVSCIAGKIYFKIFFIFGNHNKLIGYDAINHDASSSLLKTHEIATMHVVMNLMQHCVMIMTY